MCATLMALVTVSSAFLVSSSYSVRNFSRVDLAPNLRTFIDHEEIRLKVLKGLNDTETEIPLVEQRLATFKAMEKSLEVNKTNTAFQKSMKSNHPTSIFNAVRNYMSEFSNRYDNRTLYGDRFREFITKDLTGPVPDHQDLHRVGMALSVIENVYNFNMEELHKGIVGGHQGEPLSCADMYDIALTMISDGLLAGASQWMEAALHDMDMDNLKREDMTFDVSSALSMLARVAFAKDDKDKCLKLYEKAIELEPEDEDLYKEYVSHRFGREVNKLDELDVDSVEEWRKSFFRLCRVSLTLEGDNVYEVGNKTNQRLHCRYKPSAWTPYAVYREEIVSVSPFISIIYNFISDAQADEVINKTQDKLDHFVLPGNDRVTLWQFKGDLFKDQDYPVIANVSWKVGDVAHMNVKQKTKKTQVSFGEPIHVMDYGISGLALPHAEFKKEYHTAYMNIDNGKRFATMTVPLADVAVGGAIVFINQNVTIAPKKGMGILYYSWTPAGMQENDLYVGTCPLAVGENIVLEKGLWWTIYDTTNYCGKKKHSNHLARERIIANHKALVAAQKPKLKLNEEYLKKEVAKAKAALKT